MIAIIFIFIFKRKEVRKKERKKERKKKRKKEKRKKERKKERESYVHREDARSFRGTHAKNPTHYSRNCGEDSEVSPCPMEVTDISC